MEMRKSGKGFESPAAWLGDKIATRVQYEEVMAPVALVRLSFSINGSSFQPVDMRYRAQPWKATERKSLNTSKIRPSNTYNPIAATHAHFSPLRAKFQNKTKTAAITPLMVRSSTTPAPPTL